MIKVLSNPVLVLNANYVPISITTVWKAIKKLFKGRYVVLDEDYQRYGFAEWIDNWSDAADVARLSYAESIRCGEIVFKAPEVVVAVEYKGYPPNKRRVYRKGVYKRDGNTCQYCGKKFASDKLNLDHIVPKSKGGKTTWKNVVLSCIKCNQRKANRTPKEAGMKLLRKPKVPHWASLLSKKGKTPRSWEEFLGKMYWNAPLD